MDYDYRWIFGLMAGFIGSLDTACDYTLNFLITHTSAHRHVSTAIALLQLPMAGIPFFNLSFQITTGI
jgi:hypothetical protein